MFWGEREGGLPSPSSCLEFIDCRPPGFWFGATWWQNSDEDAGNRLTPDTKPPRSNTNTIYKVCGNRESNLVGPIDISLDQIGPPGDVRAPRGPQEGRKGLLRGQST